MSNQADRREWGQLKAVLVVLEIRSLGDERKRKTFARHLADERNALAKELDALCAKRFSCQEDAETAAGAFLRRADQGLHPVDIEVVPVSSPLPYHRRGRPSKDDPVRHLHEFAITGKIGTPDPARLEREQQLWALFVLITNLDDLHAFPARRLLEEYRDQNQVEQRVESAIVCK